MKDYQEIKQKPDEILKQYFGYDTFYPGQEEVIRAVLSGRDALAVMPTGAGKSVCYQVPALLLPGITLVVSPLISLMQDQVKALNAAGIHAAYINSSLTEIQIDKALRLASEGMYKIIYVAPERLESAGFLRFAQEAEISMVTVDEAHCISQWGQDFRPSYLKILSFIRRLAKRPVLSAFTATATPEVKEDICCVLGLQDPLVLATGFDRPNLFFEVESGTKKDAYVLDYIRKHPGESGIIYCATRKAVDSLFELLFKAGVNVTRYHAGMGALDRKRNQDDFVYDRIPIMTATNAFGMGIDKSNVRFVIHYNMPQSMENYYQEAGRAGRDGEAATCVLLFSAQDVVIDRMLLERKDFSEVPPEDVENIRDRDLKRLRIMENYCRTTQCLRSFILSYFGEKETKECGNCGNCRTVLQEADMTREAKWVINCVTEARGRFGMNIITGTLSGANRARLRETGAVSWKSYGALSDVKEDTLKELIRQMVQLGYLIQTEEQYSVLKAGPHAMDLKDDSVRVILRTREKKDQPVPKRDTGRKRSTDSLTSLGFELFERLRELRLQIAREASLPPYIVFTDRTLIEMCVKLPDSREGLLDVSGVARAKYEKYGEQFLEEIRSFVSRHPGQVISTYEPDPSESEKKGKAEKKGKTGVSGSQKTGSRAKKEEFALTPEEAESFAYADFYSPVELRDHLNEACTSGNRKKIAAADFNRFLLKEGLMEERKDAGPGTMILPSPKGEELGLTTREVISKAGNPYPSPRYPRNIQRMIVEHFTESGKAEV